MRTALDYLIYVCAVLIVGAGAFGAYDAVTAPAAASVTTAGDAPRAFDVLPTPFPGRSKVTVLLIGADDRKDEGGRSDTMILLFVNPRTEQVAMLSVPRDLLVPIEGHGTTKINASYAHGGVELARKTIEQNFGASIDYYAKADFKSFVEIVDMLGGVDVEVPDVEGRGRGMNYDDNWDNLHIHLKPGLQHLDGTQAIGFVRWRKSNTPGLGDGDFRRSERQQEFLKAMVQQKLKITNALQLARVAPKVLRWIQTDMSVREAAELGLVLKNVKPQNLLQASLQPYLRDVTVGGASCVATSDSSIQRVMEEIDDHLGAAPEGTLSVVVLNGSGKRGAAGAAGGRLSREGFEVSDTGNADSFDYEHTIIRHRPDQRASAQAVRRALGTGELEEIGDDQIADQSTESKITVIVGDDLQYAEPES